MSCGFTGLVALQGALLGRSWRGEVLANEHPTYYGMRLSAIWWPCKNPSALHGRGLDPTPSQGSEPEPNPMYLRARILRVD